MAFIKTDLPPYDFGEATFRPFKDIKFSLKLSIWYTVALLPTVIAAGIIAGILISNPEAIWAFGLILPAALLFLLAHSSFLTAFHRRALTGEGGGFMPLRFGRAEWRTFYALIIWFGVFLLGLACLVVIAIVVSMAKGFFMSIARLAELQILTQTLQYFIVAVSGGIVLFGTLYMTARLSTIVPTAFLDEKVSPTRAVEASEGRGWWIALSYVVGWVILVATVVVFGLLSGLVSGGPPPGADLDVVVMEPKPANPILAMVGLLIGLVQLIVQNVLVQIFPGIGAYVTAKSRGERLGRQANDVFA